MPLEFEKPILALERQINDLVATPRRPRTLRLRRRNPTPSARRTSPLSLKIKPTRTSPAWETVQVARHPARPQTRDYIEMIVKDFDELHGDRTFGDDKTMVSGMGRIGGHKVMVIGHHKGPDTKEKIACNFGCAHPEGYRKALAKMKLAEKYGIPIVTLVDTPARYPGIGRVRRTRRRRSHRRQLSVKWPRLQNPHHVCIVIGGRRLRRRTSASAVCGDRLAMMQYAWYSVISLRRLPPASSGKTRQNAPEAAEAAGSLTSNAL